MRGSKFPRPPCIFVITPSRQEPLQMSELNLREILPKTVSRYQGSCEKNITLTDAMLIKSFGTRRWTDKKTGKEISKHGPMYITEPTYKGMIKNTTGQTKDSITPLLHWLMKHVIIYRMKI